MTSTLSYQSGTTAPIGVSVNVSHGTLSHALDVFRSVSNPRPAVSILSGVKVTAAAGRISAAVYDYETAVTYDLGTTDSIDGTMVVPFALLDARAKALVKGTTKVRAAGLNVTLSETLAAVPAVIGTPDPDRSWAPRIGAVPAISGQSALVADGYTYTIPTMDADDYPALPESTELSAFADMDRDALQLAVTRAKVSAGTDGTLPMLTGILMTTDDAAGGVNLVSTDRFRLNVAPVVASYAGSIKALVPAGALAKLVKHLPAGTVSLEFDATTVYISAGPIRASIRLLDTEFVKYASLLPRELDTTLLVNRKALMTAVERVAVVVNRHHHVRLTVSGSGVVLSAGGSDDGSATSPTIAGDVSSASGITLLVGVNAVYLLDALKADTSDMVAMGFTTAHRPMLLANSVDGLLSTSAFRQLVMPARLPE